MTDSERQQRVMRAVLLERVRQDWQWGGPDHDDTHADIAMWVEFIKRQIRRVPDRPVERLVKIAALAIAAIEMLDRKDRGPLLEYVERR